MHSGMQEGAFSMKEFFKIRLIEKINDILNNSGFKRLIDGDEVELSAKDSAAYANSVNSVHYFALLPYNLKDDAVLAHNKEGCPYKREAL